MTMPTRAYTPAGSPAKTRSRARQEAHVNDTLQDAGRHAVGTAGKWFRRWRNDLMQRLENRTLRVGIDVDGVMADARWKRPPWDATNGWEQLPLLDGQGLARAVDHVRRNRWEAYAITARPAARGRSVQQQTRRWLAAHDALELSVVIDPGNRAAIARALALDWVIDDTLEQCCHTTLETPARAIWIAPEPSTEQLRETEFAGCDQAANLSAAIDIIESR